MPPLHIKQERVWAGWIDLTLWWLAIWAKRGIWLVALALLLGLAFYWGRIAEVNEMQAVMLAKGCVP